MQMCAHTWGFVAEKAWDLALAVFLLLVRQQLVNKLPDHLFGWSIQHREHIHDQSVNIPVAMETQARWQRSPGCSQIYANNETQT